MRNMSAYSFGKKWQSSLMPRKEQGAVAIVVALSIVVLVGFVGLALDLGKLYVTKTELQNSADACALAAARELTGASNNQLVLAESAGIATGTNNNVFFQDDKVTLTSNNNVTFSDALNGTYQTKDAVANALTMKFARCTVERTGIANWFVQVLGIGDQQVRATAVASLVPGQTACAIPIVICESSLTGKVVGDWLESVLDPGEGLTGSFLWTDFTGKGTGDIKDYLTGPGQCNLGTLTAKTGKPGSNVGAYDAWNTRFGLYKGKVTDSDIATAQPDYTGYAYTAKNGGVDGKCANAYPLIKQNRAKNDPYLESVTGLKVAPPANSISSDKHKEYGGDRRIVSVPVVNCADFGASQEATVKSWACVLMLHPLDQNAKDVATQCAGSAGGVHRVFLEYLGAANNADSPCATSGAVGGPGSIGPLVPALVQ